MQATPLPVPDTSCIPTTTATPAVAPSLTSLLQTPEPGHPHAVAAAAEPVVSVGKRFAVGDRYRLAREVDPMEMGKSAGLKDEEGDGRQDLNWDSSMAEELGVMNGFAVAPGLHVMAEEDLGKAEWKEGMFGNTLSHATDGSEVKEVDLEERPSDHETATEIGGSHVTVASKEPLQDTPCLDTTRHDNGFDNALEQVHAADIDADVEPRATTDSEVPTAVFYGTVPWPTTSRPTSGHEPLVVRLPSPVGIEESKVEEVEEGVARGPEQGERSGMVEVTSSSQTKAHVDERRGEEIDQTNRLHAGEGAADPGRSWESSSSLPPSGQPHSRYNHHPQPHHSHPNHPHNAKPIHLYETFYTSPANPSPIVQNPVIADTFTPKLRPRSYLSALTKAAKLAQAAAVQGGGGPGGPGGSGAANSGTHAAANNAGGIAIVKGSPLSRSASSLSAAATSLTHAPPQPMTRFKPSPLASGYAIGVPTVTVSAVPGQHVDATHPDTLVGNALQTPHTAQPPLGSPLATAGAISSSTFGAAVPTSSGVPPAHYSFLPKKSFRRRPVSPSTPPHLQDAAAGAAGLVPLSSVATPPGPPKAVVAGAAAWPPSHPEAGRLLVVPSRISPDKVHLHDDLAAAVVGKAERRREKNVEEGEEGPRRRNAAVGGLTKRRLGKRGPRTAEGKAGRVAGVGGDECKEEGGRSSSLRILPEQEGQREPESDAEELDDKQQLNYLEEGDLNHPGSAVGLEDQHGFDESPHGPDDNGDPSARSFSPSAVSIPRPIHEQAKDTGSHIPSLIPVNVSTIPLVASSAKQGKRKGSSRKVGSPVRNVHLRHRRRAEDTSAEVLWKNPAGIVEDEPNEMPGGDEDDSEDMYKDEMFEQGASAPRVFTSSDANGLEESQQKPTVRIRLSPKKREMAQSTVQQRPRTQHASRTHPAVAALRRPPSTPMGTLSRQNSQVSIIVPDPEKILATAVLSPPCPKHPVHLNTTAASKAPRGGRQGQLNADKAGAMPAAQDPTIAELEDMQSGTIHTSDHDPDATPANPAPAPRALKASRALQQQLAAARLSKPAVRSVAASLQPMVAVASTPGSAPLSEDATLGGLAAIGKMLEQARGLGHDVGKGGAAGMLLGNRRWRRVL
ncbi:hypothetical protein HDU96_003462 [Phlyctochytrium bullatum]|nr:hypothetical protein HDU96_003462 [Phlyctochytrium bullatum]